jgi:two-component system, sensor histidine kinase and response regulator
MEAENPQKAPSKREAAAETLRVMIVDDELGMRLGATRVLDGLTVSLPEADGQVRVTTCEASSGEEAIERLAEVRPDIVLLDHKLPGMSGLDVLEVFNRKQVESLVIMITAYASLDVAVSATKRGAFDFLAKPFTPEELKASLRKAARHHILRSQARRLAAEKRQVRFQFLSVLVHELKAPLAAVEGYLRLIEEGGQDPATLHHTVGRSLVRIEGMRKLILDLLDLTRIESGQRQREIVDVDLVEVARTALETSGPPAAERQLTLELHAPVPVVLAADRAELDIMLNNLVSNAVKYNRPGGRVDVTITRAGDVATVKVQDTGIGMSAKETTRLFGEFVRIKNEKTRNISGSGLGLSILKRLATMYGGDVTVASTPDAGTTFTVTIKPAER